MGSNARASSGWEADRAEKRKKEDVTPFLGQKKRKKEKREKKKKRKKDKTKRKRRTVGRDQNGLLAGHEAHVLVVKCPQK